MIRNRALVALSACALAGCSGSHGTDGRTTQQETVASVGAPGATPFGVMAPGATAATAVAASSPAASASSPAASASPGAAPAVVPAASGAAAVASPVGTAPPRILSVHTSPAVVHDGDTLLWNVRTTPDVVDVVAHVALYAFRLQKQGSGQYVLTFTIPHGVPGFFHGNYTLDLVARSGSGALATTKVPVSFQ